MSEDWEQELDDIQEEKKKEEEEKKKKEEEEKKKKEEEEKKKKEEEEKKKKEEEEKKKNKDKKVDKKDDKKEEDKKDSKNIILKNEKDYIELAKRNAEKIKNAKPLPIFTLAYLQNIIELLGPSLEINQINELLKLSNNIFNKKLNEGERKKVSTKFNYKVGKFNEKDNGEYDDYEDDEEEEEDDVPDDIDKYV